MTTMTSSLRFMPASAHRAAALASSAIAALLVAASPTVSRAQMLSLPSVPWFVGQNAPPNILLTLDDSGSMTAAFAPESFRVDVGGAAHIALKSNLNPLYYDPKVKYPIPPSASGVPYTTSYTAARRNGFDPSRGIVDLSANYRPEDQYWPEENYSRTVDHCRPVDQKGPTCLELNIGPKAPTRGYWWTYKDGATGCPSRPSLKTVAILPVACFSLGHPQTDEEKQNFANWYSFYRSRNLATISAAMIGFHDLPVDYRIAWQGLGETCTAAGFSRTCRGWDATRPTVDARIGAFDANKRADMWRWLERLPTDSWTPLRSAMIRAGEYLKTEGPVSPYADRPGASDTSYTSCRASYSVAMTDGIWNRDTVTSIGNPDDAPQVMPDGTLYTPRAPYRDSNSNSVADIAFRYWITDLQPKLTNNLRPFFPYMAGAAPTDSEYWDPRNDPGNWQRMTSFFVGLGLSSSLRDPGWYGSTFAAGPTTPADGYPRFASGAAAWPKAASNADPGNVYDLWHAAIASRGHFYSADSPSTLIEAFKDLRNRISSREAGASAAASTSLRVQADSMVFAATFSSSRWDGTLRAFRLLPDGSVDPTPAWSTDTTFDHLANGSVGPHRVLTRDSAGGLTTFSPHALNALPPKSRDTLGSQAAKLGVTETELVRWLLGDTSNSALRRRARLLGDLVNSAPLYEGARDYHYASTSWTDSDRIDGTVYSAFLGAKRNDARARPTVYVGSNDGMLHAFDAQTGAHRFAFLPTPSLVRIGQRASPTAGHAWYVDGQIVAHDVHDGQSWRTILVASMGAGARGMFALDITHDLPSPKLLWEWFPDGQSLPYIEPSSEDPDMGHVLGEPSIARAQDGTWVVVFGNGYGSKSNKAVLYALDALTGEVLNKIAVGGASATANGLSPAALLYTAGRQLAFGYAGDLNGNLWRFDLSGPPKSWTLSFAEQPLFTATGPSGQRQPITAKPRIASDRLAGRILLFGTGRLLASSDPRDSAVQSVYGILDRATGGTAQRGLLTRQTIVAETGYTRTLSANAQSTDSAGWYLDLNGTGTTTGERVIAPVNFIPESTMITVSTVRPVVDAGACDSEFTSWLMTLSPFTGKAVNVFAAGGGAQRAGHRLDNVLASATPIRKGNSRMKLTVNAGSNGLRQIDGERAWNPRTAWQQIR
jgi:type IV pilus assembly protein PilY1